MPTKSWKNKKILITSGATREYLDPVRYLTNASSGRMGAAIAAAARRRGARVTLVTGLGAVPAPKGVTVVPVVSARDMLAACLKALPGTDLVVAAAAVADWRPATLSIGKIKKTGAPSVMFKMVPNPDILGALTKKKKNNRPLAAGFALETDDLILNARAKMTKKKLDLIIANGPEALNDDRTHAMILARDGGLAFYTGPKSGLADKMLDVLAGYL